MFAVGVMFAVIFWGFLVLRASNAVHSVLSLVMVFALTAILFLLLGAEFFALLLFTVYIGAIAILFLFVIMMLDLRLAEIHGSAYYHVPLGASVGLAFLAALYSFLAPELLNLAWAQYSSHLWIVTPQSNLKILGQVLYNYYLPFVFLVTLILLLAMVAVIALTLEENPKPRPTLALKSTSHGNVFWSSMDHCYKGPVLDPWWEPLAPSLAVAKRQSVTQWRKWPLTSYTQKSKKEN